MKYFTRMDSFCCVHSRRYGLWLLLFLAFPLMAFRPISPNNDLPDLSSPEKSFLALIEILKSGNTEALPSIATQTGIHSLVALYGQTGFEDGLVDLGNELAASEPTWDAITDEIYVAQALENGHLHKMEFTREEPGWMLYHWQLGGGVSEDAGE